MHQFKISPDSFAQTRRKTLLTSVPLTLLAFFVGGFLPNLIGKGGGNFDASFLLVMIPLMAGALGFVVWKGLKRQRQWLESYTLTVEAHDLVREQFDTPTLRIPKKDITHITKHANGNFAVKGSHETAELLIPAQIEHYADLERLLRETGPVTELTFVPASQKYALLLVVVQLGVFALHLISTNPVVVVTSGVAVIGMQLRSFFLIQRNKNIDNKTARWSYWVLFIILMVLLRIGYTVF